MQNTTNNNPYRVLIVSSEPRFSLGINVTVSEAGFEPTVIASTPVACEVVAFRNDTYDVVLLDADSLEKPVEDIAFKMFSLAPKTKLILMTGKEKNPEILSLREQGAVCDYIRKPFDHWELVERMELMIDGDPQDLAKG